MAAKDERGKNAERDEYGWAGSMAGVIHPKGEVRRNITTLISGQNSPSSGVFDFPQRGARRYLWLCVEGADGSRPSGAHYGFGFSYAPRSIRDSGGSHGDEWRRYKARRDGARRPSGLRNEIVFGGPG
jgi:hypothetical protein